MSQTIFFDTGGYFEISECDILRVYCIQEVKSSDLTLLSVQKEGLSAEFYSRTHLSFALS